MDDPHKLARDLKDEESSPSSSSAANPDSKRRRTEPSQEEEAKTDARKMFQRLWTEEDEIAILKGFLDFSSSPRSSHDNSGAFYDQIRASIRLDFNKNQLVEKLRRLKKKYRNVAGRIRSGKDFAFKSAHDRTAYDLSGQIWGGGDRIEAAAPAAKSKPSDRVEAAAAKYQQSDRVDEQVTSQPSDCLMEIIRLARPGVSGLGAIPLGIGDAAAEKWRRQQILELEVFSRRIDLVQEQIKVLLAELRSRR